MCIRDSTQMLTDYESNNPLRVLTGFAAGVVGGWWFCSVLCARTKYFGDDPSSVLLPADARLTLK